VISIRADVTAAAPNNLDMRLGSSDGLIERCAFCEASVAIPVSPLLRCDVLWTELAGVFFLLIESSSPARARLSARVSRGGMLGPSLGASASGTGRRGYPTHTP
jgi:hypothetical protein